MSTRLKIAWKALCHRRLGLFALAFLVLVLLAGLLAPLIAPHDPMMMDMKNRLAPCSFEHLLGTDHLGRDLFSRLLYGARTSMGMALSVMLVTVGVGSLLGLVAGAFRGIFDTILMRVTDVFMSFPSEVLVLALVGMAGPGMENAFLACVLARWPWYARMARSFTLNIRDRNYVSYARVAGFSKTHILFRHIVPNTLGELCVLATLDCASVLLMISALSFLGLGVQPPTPEWGTMLGEARNVMILHPWQMLPPGLAILTVVASFNFLGDALRDTFDPYGKPGGRV